MVAVIFYVHNSRDCLDSCFSAIIALQARAPLAPLKNESSPLCTTVKVLGATLPTPIPAYPPQVPHVERLISQFEGVTKPDAGAAGAAGAAGGGGNDSSDDDGDDDEEVDEVFSILQKEARAVRENENSAQSHALSPRLSLC